MVIAESMKMSKTDISKNMYFCSWFFCNSMFTENQQLAAIHADIPGAYDDYKKIQGFFSWIKSKLLYK